jgi:DNA (cytosine-5)-methyltransferase 1
MDTPIPIIDIFAGPGGLGEGFSALMRENGEPLFKIKLSIEKDEFAHQTLELRAFYRQFVGRPIPPDYYDYLQKKISRKTLFEKYKTEALQAANEAWRATLGKTSDEKVRTRIKDALNGVSNWVLIGGPPCQAYSLVGRSRIRGKDKKEKRKYREDRRHFLYKEYLQILADHQPPVFVMENVKGLLSSRRIQKQSTFDLIISDLESPLSTKRINSNEPLEYKLFSVSKKRTEGSERIEPKDFVVRSENYGIPQARHRIIILGIRSDVYNSDPEVLDIVKDHTFIDDVIGDLPPLRSGLSKEIDTSEKWSDAIQSIAKAKWLDSEKVSVDLKQAIISTLKKVDASLIRGEPFVQFSIPPEKQSGLEWYIDKTWAGLCNHESRSHIREDLHRYFFASVYASLNDRSPTLNDFPPELLPKHENVQEALTGSKFNDRFRVQISGKPSTTVVSHISKDGHYYIHYDPSQCRSLTVREAARLQTFPDNYLFEGNRTQQYHQVGNAVPPMLAHKIAKIVYKVLESSE